MVFVKKEAKILAIQLRKERKSYREIAEQLQVSKSTVSVWLKNIEWSRDIQSQLTCENQALSEKRLRHLNNLKKIKWAQIYSQAEDEALRDFQDLKSLPLFIAGMSIYWGEGDKNFVNGQTRVSNIDPQLLVVFRLFLEKICCVSQEKIKAYMVLYPDLDADTCTQYWSEQIGIHKEKFFRPSFISGKHKSRRLSYGVCTIQVSDKYLKKKVLTWLDLFAKLSW